MILREYVDYLFMSVKEHVGSFPGIHFAQDLIYKITERDEVEDMLQLLAFAKDMHPEIEAVSSGAIASVYQRQRVEHVSQQPSSPSCPAHQMCLTSPLQCSGQCCFEQLVNA